LNTVHKKALNNYYQYYLLKKMLIAKTKWGVNMIKVRVLDLSKKFYIMQHAEKLSINNIIN